VKAPEGSFLNPRPPAGGGPRAIICYRTFESVLGALAPRAADRVCAAASHMANPTFGGWDRARRPAVRRVRARAFRDGARAPGRLRGDGVGVQRLEHSGRGAGGRPADVVERFELIAIRAAPATYRGGCGIRRDLGFSPTRAS
jgi:N-methylhydantoinase B